MAIEGVSPSLFAVVRPAIDPDPTKRPPSAGALAGELRAWLEADAMPAAPADPAAVTEMAIPVPLPPDQVVPDQAAPDQQEPPPPPANAPRSRPAPPTPPGRRPPRLAVALATLALVIIAILAVMALAAPGAKPEPPFPSVSPSLVPSPSQTPVATPVVTPAPPTFEEAVAQFRALVDSGSEAGQLDGDAAEELRERLDEVVAAVNEGHPGQINRAFRDLRRAIGDIEQDEASPELVADLLALADAMQAAT
jgi:hypothetical protein